MRRWLVLSVSAALLVGAAACGGQDDESGEVDTEAPELDLTAAVTAAQAAMPLELPDSRVRILLEDLCEAGAGDAAGIVAQLAEMPFADPAQAEAVVAALDAGTADACPGDVAPAVREQVAAGALAAAPTTTTLAPAAATGSGSNGSSSSGATGSGSGSSATSGNSSSSGSSNSSSGDGVVGSGNANGSGNQSTTNFGQGVTSNSTTG